MASRFKRSVPVTVNDVLDGHVALDLECLDRLYLHGYLGQLQVGGQVIQFLTHRGFKIYSAACLQQIGDGFRRRVASFAEANDIPVVTLKAADRNIEVMRPYLVKAAASGRSQVAAIGVAQEVQRVFLARQRDTDPSKPPQFSFGKKDRRVTVYYFYLWDASFGDAFIKVCTYCPWPMKIWVNGHEWAKQQARKAGLGFTELSNGFASCEDPALLQRICDVLQPGTIEVFFQRWLARLPLPLGPDDQRAGYWWELSMAQVEVSRTIVFDAPRHARAFFEALVTDNLDLGRPDTIEIIFDRQVRADTASEFKTKIVSRGTEVTVNAFYKHSRIKQYLKDQRALRIRPSSTRRVTLAANGACVILMSSRPGRVRSMSACCTLNVPARAASLRIQSSSGSRTPPLIRRGGELQPCDLATLGSRPWPAPCASPCAPSPASPTGACAP